MKCHYECLQFCRMVFGKTLSLVSNKNIFIICAILLLCYYIIQLSDYSMLFVHPHTYWDFAPFFPDIATNFWKEIANIREIVEFDCRPRYLNWFIWLLDIKAHDWSMYHFFIPPTFSFSWIFTLLLSPLFLYKSLLNLKIEKAHARLCLLVYFTSFSVQTHLFYFFLPSKYLSMFFLIFTFYLGSNLVRKNEYRNTYYSTLYRTKEVWLLFGACAISFLADDTSLAIIIVFPFVFYDLFLPSKLSIASIKKNYASIIQSILLFFSPVFLFLISLPLTFPSFYYYVLQQGLQHKSTQNQGIFSKLIDIVCLMYPNFIALFSTSLFPYWAYNKAPLLNPLDWDAGKISFNQMRPDFFKAILVVLLFLWICVLVKKSRNLFGRRFILGLIMFLFAHSLANSFHLQVVNGYYYGANFALFITLFIAVLSQILPSTRVVFPLVVLCILMTQILNFNFFNTNQLAYQATSYKEYVANTVYFQPQTEVFRDIFQKKWKLNLVEFHMKTAGDFMEKEQLHLILDAWKKGELWGFLEKNPIRANNVYLPLLLSRLPTPSKDEKKPM